MRNVLQAYRSNRIGRTVCTDSLQKGSLTVEAAWAGPLFFLCVAMLICMMNIYGMTARQEVQLQEKAEAAAVAAGVAGGEDLPAIDLPLPVRYELRLFPGVHPVIVSACRARVRPWTGRDPASYEKLQQEASEKLVLVTENQSVYHLDESCTHLSLRVRPTSSASLKHLRTSDGGRFHACEKCVGRGKAHAVVYVTGEGDRYHNAANCSGLTRHVRMVPESSVKDLHVCSRCQEKYGSESKT